MTAVTTQKTLYTFAELSEEAQVNAVERFRKGTLDYDWWGCVYDDATAIAALFGVRVDQIYFSGFNSQGDGACFEGSFAYKKGALKAIKAYSPLDSELHAIVSEYCEAQRKAFYRLEGTVKQSGRYNHEGCTSFRVRGNGWDANAEQEDSIITPLRAFMTWIYRALEREHDWLQSDENIRETIESNGYEFDANGVMQ